MPEIYTQAERRFPFSAFVSAFFTLSSSITHMQDSLKSTGENRLKVMLTSSLKMKQHKQLRKCFPKHRQPIMVASSIVSKWSRLCFNEFSVVWLELQLSTCGQKHHFLLVSHMDFNIDHMWTQVMLLNKKGKLTCVKFYHFNSNSNLHTFHQRVNKQHHL